MSGRQVRSLVALFAVAAPLVACSAIVSFSGLAGSALGEDAAADATSADGAPLIDGGAATDATNADATPAAQAFCADAAAFVLCDDFDDASARLLDTWDNVFIGNSGGAIVVDDAASVSPPGSLLSTCAGGGIDNGSLVQKTFTGHTRAVLSADVRLDVSDNGGYGAVLEIHLSPFPAGISDYRVALIYSSGRMTLDVYAQGSAVGSTSNAVPVQLDFSSWQRISIELAMNPTPHATAYDKTGTAVATLPMPAFTGSSTNTGQYVMVGVTYLTTNAVPWKVRHDNVTVSLGD